jgi:hypothetical protein
MKLRAHASLGGAVGQLGDGGLEPGNGPANGHPRMLRHVFIIGGSQCQRRRRARLPPVAQDFTNLTQSGRPRRGSPVEARPAWGEAKTAWSSRPLRPPGLGRRSSTAAPLRPPAGVRAAPTTRRRACSPADPGGRTARHPADGDRARRPPLPRSRPREHRSRTCRGTVRPATGRPRNYRPGG